MPEIKIEDSNLLPVPALGRRGSVHKTPEKNGRRPSIRNSAEVLRSPDKKLRSTPRKSGGK